MAVSSRACLVAGIVAVLLMPAPLRAQSASDFSHVIDGRG